GEKLRKTRHVAERNPAHGGRSEGIDSHGQLSVVRCTRPAGAFVRRGAERLRGAPLSTDNGQKRAQRAYKRPKAVPKRAQRACQWRGFAVPNGRGEAAGFSSSARP